MKIFRLNAVIAISFLFVQFALAVNPVAVVIRAKGKVVMINQDKKQVSVKPGTKIYSGSKIVTETKSFAAIKFIDDGSLVRVRQNSTCTVEGKQEKNSLLKNIFLEVGTIFSKITRQKGSFRVTTPTSVASVKGTAFWSVQEFKGATTYFGEEGIVEIENKKGVARLGADETGIVASINSKPIVRRTRSGEKPVLDEDKSSVNEFEFEFGKENGQKKNLKFKIKTKK